MNGADTNAMGKLTNSLPRAVVQGAIGQFFLQVPAYISSVRKASIFLLSAASTPQTGTETRLAVTHSFLPQVSSFLDPWGTSRFWP